MQNKFLVVFMHAAIELVAGR